MNDDSPKKFISLLNNKRNEVENQIKKIEKIIYDNETKYLETTASGGNIFRGWEHIFTSKSKFPHNLSSIKRPRISNNERIFSQTSVNNFFLKEDAIMVINNMSKNREFGITSSQNNTLNNNQRIINNNSNNRNQKKIKQSLSIKKKKLGGGSGQKDKKIDMLPV